MQDGIVKFYNSARGYGFIQPDNGASDVFVHATALERAGMDALAEGQKARPASATSRRAKTTRPARSHDRRSRNRPMGIGSWAGCAMFYEIE
jgi:CspA family cold shock protein